MKEAIEKLVAVMDSVGQSQSKVIAALANVTAEVEGKDNVPDDVWMLFKGEVRVLMVNALCGIMAATSPSN